MFLVLMDGVTEPAGYSDATFTHGTVEGFGIYRSYEAAVGKCIQIAEAAIEDFDAEDGDDESWTGLVLVMRDESRVLDERLLAAEQIVDAIYSGSDVLALVAIGVKG